MLAKNHFQIKKENDNNYPGNILSSLPIEEDFFTIVSKSNFQIAIDISIAKNSLKVKSSRA